MSEPREFDELQFIIDSIRPVNTGKDSVEPLLKIQLEQIRRNLIKSYDQLKFKINIYEKALIDMADLDNPNKLSHICSPASEYMRKSRQALEDAKKVGDK